MDFLEHRKLNTRKHMTIKINIIIKRTESATRLLIFFKYINVLISEDSVREGKSCACGVEERLPITPGRKG